MAVLQNGTVVCGVCPGNLGIDGKNESAELVRRHGPPVPERLVLQVWDIEKGESIKKLSLKTENIVPVCMASLSDGRLVVSHRGVPFHVGTAVRRCDGRFRRFGHGGCTVSVWDVSNPDAANVFVLTSIPTASTPHFLQSARQLYPYICRVTQLWDGRVAVAQVGDQNDEFYTNPDQLPDATPGTCAGKGKVTVWDVGTCAADSSLSLCMDVNWAWQEGLGEYGTCILRGAFISSLVELKDGRLVWTHAGENIARR